jgi:hypothetical protein
MKLIEPTNRARALQIIKGLLIDLPYLTADIFFQSLLNAGFSDDEATRLTGACIRTASSLEWMSKTNRCQTSIKNHSNLMNIWSSKLCPEDKDCRPELAEWFEQGFEVQIPELDEWKEWKAKNVSKQSGKR